MLYYAVITNHRVTVHEITGELTYEQVRKDLDCELVQVCPDSYVEPDLRATHGLELLCDEEAAYNNKPVYCEVRRTFYESNVMAKAIAGPVIVTGSQVDESAGRIWWGLPPSVLKTQLNRFVYMIGFSNLEIDVPLSWQEFFK